MNISTDRIKEAVFLCRTNKHKMKYSQEYRALAVLRYYIPEEFNCVVCSDRPDLQGPNIGVEVVSVTDARERQVEADYDKYRNLNPLSSATKQIAVRLDPLYKIDFALGKPILDYPVRTALYEKEVFQKAIKKKVKYIREYKERFDKTGLVVMFSDIPTSECEENLVNWIKEAFDETGSDYYDKFYIISHRFLCVVESLFWNAQIDDISSDEWHSLSVIGRLTAEGTVKLTDEEWK